MNPPEPAETKLVISSYHRFTLWRSPPEMAAAVRERWPEMRVVDLPHYDRITPELPDTDIFVGLTAAAGAIARSEAAEVGAHDFGGRGPTDVSGISRLGDYSHQCQRRTCTGDGGAHRRDDRGDGAGFPGRDALSSTEKMGAAGDLGWTRASTGTERRRGADCGLRRCGASSRGAAARLSECASGR